ncbi:hypothetical protein VTN77DRAFT_9067 [Rasamsonia byssochlamydoides]|uniref:uncharacterized protein n=1 Tax=Rasamsonia byssochlamydoides TaxID=89139 RepID=UPI003742039F
MPNRYNDDEDYFLPLEDQRVFGAGIKRKRVPFVRPSDHATLSTTTEQSTTTTARQTSEPAPSVADRYLSIVLPKQRSAQLLEKRRKIDGQDDSETASAPPSLGPSPAPLEEGESLNNTKRINHHEETVVVSQKICDVCNLPLTETTTSSSSSSTVITDGDRPKPPPTPHEASIAHQVCLEHSHPPSHLDRTRHGLRYLASYGWDPDSRLGLGAPGREGIREPIKPKVKHDTVGLGMEIDPEALAQKQKVKQQQQEARKKLNAKQVRLREMEAKKKGEKLHEMFYRSEDVQRYLGGGI